MVLTERWKPFRYMADAIRNGRGDELKAALERAQKGREELHAHFKDHPAEIARADLEIELEIFLDSFALSGIIPDNKTCGNAIVTALAHNLARYIALSASGGADAAQILRALEERVVSEINRMLREKIINES